MGHYLQTYSEIVHMLIHWIYDIKYLPSQLVDLKAELYRKQQEFRQEKLTQHGDTSAGGSVDRPKLKVTYNL